MAMPGMAGISAQMRVNMCHMRMCMVPAARESLPRGGEGHEKRNKSSVNHGSSVGL
jgi:hypothetical protein